MKPGIKTTEFWITAGAVAAGVSNIVYKFIVEHCDATPTELLVVGGMVIAYIAQRGWVKSRTK